MRLLEILRSLQAVAFFVFGFFRDAVFAVILFHLKLQTPVII